MATVSAVITLLVVASFVIVESFPEGCTKLSGSPEDGKPGEFFVKVHPYITDVTLVNVMLELVTSGCEGKLWRSSNTSNAVMEPITCSGMYLIPQGHGFFAKMSNAAVMWVSNQCMHGRNS